MHISCQVVCGRRALLLFTNTGWFLGHGRGVHEVWWFWHVEQCAKSVSSASSTSSTPFNSSAAELENETELFFKFFQKEYLLVTHFHIPIQDFRVKYHEFRI